jgi:hypothetical protein
VVVGGGQAGCLAYRAVDVSDHAARPAHNMMMVIPDASLEPGRAAGRLDAADESRRRERVQGFIYGLQGNVAYPVTHPGSDGLDAEMITVPDGLEQRYTGSRHS